jgi:hypothetical protein
MLLKPNPPVCPHPRAAIHVVRRALVVALAGSLIGGFALVAGPRPVDAQGLTSAAEPFDPEVILPGRVDASLHRTLDAVERSVAAVDDRRWSAARRSLAAAKAGFGRSHRAVIHQMTLVPDPEAEDESTAGPDSALAALNVEQVSVAMLVGLFDGVRRRGVVTRLRGALATAQQRRRDLIRVITGLDPEGAGADYADSLADTLPQYADEVAGVREALSDDRLIAPARAAVRAALARSMGANAAMMAAFGGGERSSKGVDRR